MGCFQSSSATKRNNNGNYKNNTKGDIPNPFAGVVVSPGEHRDMEENEKEQEMEALLRDLVTKKYCSEEEKDERRLSFSMVNNPYYESGTDLLVRKKYIEKPDKALSNISQIQLSIFAGFDSTGFGLKFDCQDDCDFGVQKNGDVILGVFDGHGEFGRLIAHYCARSFIKLITQHSKYITDLNTALRDTFLTMHKCAKEGSGVSTEMSGTTAVVALIRGGEVYCANLGDSRCILVSETSNGSMTARALSVDHKPDNKAEKARIEKAGGRVDAVRDDEGVAYGVGRVFKGDMDGPGLAISRTIGDDMAHSVGVSAECEIQRVPLSENDMFLVLCSDGVWEFLEDIDVAKLCEQAYKQAMTIGPHNDSNHLHGKAKKYVKLEDESPDASAAKRAAEARAREAQVEYAQIICGASREAWMRATQGQPSVIDDISSIVCKLRVRHPGVQIQETKNTPPMVAEVEIPVFDYTGLDLSPDQIPPPPPVPKINVRI